MANFCPITYVIANIYKRFNKNVKRALLKEAFHLKVLRNAVSCCPFPKEHALKTSYKFLAFSNHIR